MHQPVNIKDSDNTGSKKANEKISLSKLRISNKNDKQEAEADAVANKVMLIPSKVQSDISMSGLAKNKLQLSANENQDTLVMQTDEKEENDDIQLMPDMQILEMAGNPEEPEESSFAEATEDEEETDLQLSKYGNPNTLMMQEEEKEEDESIQAVPDIQMQEDDSIPEEPETKESGLQLSIDENQNTLMMQSEENEDEEIEDAPDIQMQEIEENQGEEEKSTIAKTLEDESFIDLQSTETEEEIDRLTEDKEESEVQPERINTKGNTKSSYASKDVENNINRTKGLGNPLPENTQSELGQKMGSDFSNVKIHTDSNAAGMNKELGARAFTHGNDIYFKSGEYNPGSSQGKRLLAHELTHTVQQGASSSAQINEIADNQMNNQETEQLVSQNETTDVTSNENNPIPENVETTTSQTNERQTHTDTRSVKEQQQEDKEQQEQEKLEEEQEQTVNKEVGEGNISEQPVENIFGKTEIETAESKIPEQRQDEKGDQDKEKIELEEQLPEHEVKEETSGSKETTEEELEEEIPEDTILSLMELIPADDEENSGEALTEQASQTETENNEPETIPAEENNESLVEELSNAIYERSELAVANIQEATKKIKNKVYARANKIKEDISIQIADGVKSIRDQYGGKISEISKIIQGARDIENKNYESALKTTGEKSKKSKEDIDIKFKNFKTDVKTKADDYAAKAVKYKSNAKETYRKEQQAQADSCRKKGETRAEIYPDTERGWTQKNAVKKVTEKVAKEIEEKIPKNVEALGKIIEPIPEEFRKQGKKMLEGIDKKKPPLYEEVNIHEESIRNEIDTKHDKLMAAFDTFEGAINEQLEQERTKSIDKLQKQEGPACNNVDKIRDSIIYKLNNSSSRVISSVQKTGSEAGDILYDKKDRKKEGLIKFKDSTFEFFAQTESETINNLSTAVDEQSKGFWSAQKSVKNIVKQQVGHVKETLPGVIDKAKDHTQKILDQGVDIYKKILVEFDRITEEFHNNIKEKFTEALTGLENGFKEVMKNAEEKVGEAKKKGLAKNNEALWEVPGKMTKAASKAAWKYDHPILSKILSILSFIAGLIVGILLVLAVVVAVILLFKVLVVGLIALGISALVAKVIVGIAALVVMGYMAYKAYKARREAGQSGWTAFFGSLGDITGITDIIKGATDPDLSPFERGFFIGKGTATVATFIFGGRLNRGVNRGLLWLSKSARFPRIAAFSKAIRVPRMTQLGKKLRLKFPKFYKKVDKLNYNLLKVREKFIRYKYNKKIKGKEQGIEKRGNRPDPRERATTKEQYKQQYRQERMQRNAQARQVRAQKMGEQINNKLDQLRQKPNNPPAITDKLNRLSQELQSIRQGAQNDPILAMKKMSAIKKQLHLIENMPAKGPYTTKITWGIHEINARPYGKGYLGERIPQSNTRVNSYELKINPNDESFYLKNSQGKFVQFENVVANTAQDGKLIIKPKSFYHVDDMPPFAKAKVKAEALRQVDAAAKNGYKIEWLVSDQNAADQLRNFFADEGINIDVIFFPE